MKKELLKYTGFIFLVLSTIHTQARTVIPWNQQGCESVGGVWIQTHDTNDAGCEGEKCNHKTFCASPGAMNWWSIHSWCYAIGATAASFSSVCPNTTMTKNDVAGACPNLANCWSGNWGVWTTTPYQGEHLLVRGSGAVAQFNLSGVGSDIHALCEEK